MGDGEAIDRIRDLLSEARRYVRTRPDVAAAAVGAALAVMDLARRGRPDLAVFVRLDANLRAGLGYIRAAPGVLEGYIDGASWELLVLLGRRREGV